MTSGLSLFGAGAGYHYESSESRALGSITSTSYDYRDQGKLVTKLTGDVSYMAAYMRKMQKGIDSANENFIQQIQSFINDIIVIFGGGGDTGFDFGDLKYILQGIGAFFGFDSSLSFPLNLLEGAWHFFINFIVPGGSFVNLINEIIDAFIATILDLFGEVPVLGQALQQLAVIISNIRDQLLPVFHALDTLFDGFGGSWSNGDFGVFQPFLDAATTFFGTITGTLLNALMPLLTIIGGWTATFLNQLADVIIVINNLISQLTGGSFFENFRIPGFGNIPTMVSHFINNGILSIQSALNSFNLFNLIPSNLFGLIPFGSIGAPAEQPNLLANPTYNSAISVSDPSNIWVWDGTTGRTTNGSVKIIATGTERNLLSNAIDVSEDQVLSVASWVKWSGLSFIGTPIRLQIVEMLEHVATGTVVDVDAPTSPGTNQATWVSLDGSYTVPAGVTQICLQLTITATATAGTIWFDDGNVHKTSGLKTSWIDSLDDILGGLLSNLQDTWDNIVHGITGVIGGGFGLSDVFDALQHIPGLNILGIGGIPNIVDTIQNTWDGFVNGIGSLFGFGGGHGYNLSDLGNTVNFLGGKAKEALDRTTLNSNILAQRAIQPAAFGLESTIESTFTLPHLGTSSTPSSYAVTATTNAMGFVRCNKTDEKGFFTWYGSGNTNITGCYVHVYSMDPITGDLTWKFTSPNIVSSLSSGWAWRQFDFAGSDQFTNAAGDVMVGELQIVGAGTHTIAGLSFGWLQNHPSDSLKRLGAVRNPAGSIVAPTTIASASINYHANTPWFGFGISSLPDDYNPPEPTQYNVAGTVTYNIPDWFVEGDLLDVIAVGAGGGAGKPNGSNLGGEGSPGSWAHTTLEYGVDIPLTTATLTLVTGAKGATMTTGNHAGNAGTASTISGTGVTTITAAGGAGGAADGTSSPPYVGTGPGNQVHNGVTYFGGSTVGQKTIGSAPGGAGGGAATSNVDGKQGADGSIWLVARQPS